MHNACVFDGRHRARASFKVKGSIYVTILLLKQINDIFLSQRSFGLLPIQHVPLPIYC